MIEQTDIILTIADLEYIRDALYNASTLSYAVDTQDRVRNLSANLTRSKLTKMLDNSVIYINKLLPAEEPPAEEGKVS